MNELSSLSEQQLEARLEKLGRIRRAVLVEIVLCLAEVLRRGLHLEAGHGKLAAYCCAVLEEERRRAWRLATAAEAVAAFPLAERLLKAKEISVAALVAVKKALTPENHEELLRSAVGLTEDEAEILASRYRPMPRRTDSIRPVHFLEPTRGGELVLVERVELRVTVTKEVAAQLDAVRAALSHKFPDGNLNEVLAECFRLTLDACDRRKLGRAMRRAHGRATAADSLPANPLGPSVPGDAPPQSPSLSPSGTSFRSLEPPLGPSTSAISSRQPALLGPSASTVDSRQPALLRSGTATVDPAHPELLGPSTSDISDDAIEPDEEPSRHIPAAVRQAVWERDGGCCSFVAKNGRRCESTYQLEFDHWWAFCLGGEHTVDNVRLLCASHNRFEAARVLGDGAMRRFRKSPVDDRQTGSHH